MGVPRGRSHEYRQAYNAQAAVDADGGQLVLSSRVSVCASDRNELVADVDAIPAALGAADRVLADSGYATGSEVSQLEGRGIEVLVATGAEGQRRRHDFRPEPPERLAKEPQADWLKAMREKMELPENRAHYRLRKQTVEPVFGIVKQAMGFRQFAGDGELSRKAEVLTSVPGIGPVTAAGLLSEMPELGAIDGKAAASLAGLAPVTRESGAWKGRSFIRGGRAKPRRMLYMAVVSAIRHNPDFVRKYRELRDRGKPPKVALTAIVRKMLVLANTLLRQDRFWSPERVGSTG